MEVKKLCSKCGKTKPRDAFHKSAKSSDGLKSQCKNCRTKEKNNYYKRTAGERRKYQKEYALANLAKAKLYYKEHYKLNKEMYLRKASEYRARKVKAKTDNHTTEELYEHLISCGCVCWYCGDVWEHWDHVIPLSRGGSHTLDNLVPACAYCNLSKGNKLMNEWQTSKGDK